MTSDSTSPGVLLISCYELGHQPLGLAWPLAALRQAGIEAAALDLAVEALDDGLIGAAGFVGIAVPMHTALRLGVQAARRARAANATAHICFFGLYAWLNRDYLLAHCADTVIGGEAEGALVRLVQALGAGEPTESVPGVATRLADSAPLGGADLLVGGRAQGASRRGGGEPGGARGASERGRGEAGEACFAPTRGWAAGGPVPGGAPGLPLPDRSTLPGLDRYARYLNGGPPALAGYVEATRGCQHLCRHCPIVPIYQGRMFVVPFDTVMADIRQQVAAGAEHIVFGDADFLNGPTHSLRITRALHGEFPRVTFNFTAKVEHILHYSRHFAEFAALGCTFVTTAVESLSDRVLEQLAKGHTAADVGAALEVLEAAGITVQPTLVAFTPWTTLDDYLALVDFVAQRGLHENIAPVQLSIRLLIPPHSPLIEAPGSAEWLGELDATNFTYGWQPLDARMDALHTAVAACVLEAEAEDRPARETHDHIRALAYATAGRPPPVEAPVAAGRRGVPRLSEDWFCCAEPNRGQVDLLERTIR